VISRLLATFFFIGLIHTSFAQGQDCANALEEAKKEFAAGHLEIISSILDECLDKLSGDDKIEAFRLLTITFLYLDNPYAAKSSFMDLLREDPEYRILADDPIELDYLSRRYITTPIISYTFKAGTNFSSISVINRYTVSSETDNNWKYSTRTGFNFLAGLNLHFSKVVSLNFELEFASRSYIFRDILFPTVEPQDIEQRRTNLHVSLPVSLKFTYPGKLYYPYVYAGYSPSYTISSRANNNRQPRKEALIEGLALDLMNITPKFSQSLIFGAGLKRRFNYKYVLIDFRYRLGMSNMLSSTSQYDFTDADVKEQQFRYLINDNDFRWSGFEVAIGFVMPIYDPRLKNSRTIQTVVKSLFSKKKKKND